MTRRPRPPLHPDRQLRIGVALMLIAGPAALLAGLIHWWLT